MYCRIGTLSLLAGMVLATPGVTQEKSLKKSTGTLERRLDEMEKQLEYMLHSMKALRQALPATVSAEEPVLEMMPLKHADAEAVAQALQQLFGARAGVDFRATNLKKDILLVFTTPMELARVRDLVAHLDAVSSAKSAPPEKALRARIAEAESNLEMVQERAVWSERMLKRGFVSQSQVQADQLRVRQAEAVLEEARQALRGAREAPKK
ncbi:MAG: hypothetical protein L0Y72_28115 [Gemmataceae bacterium]|nr:hypothetical protein [Gemmataceae bacterium]MCI0742913.1 hypothetical protein [Gemmataceae bacterium]